jgi:hypothetical protein
MCKFAMIFSGFILLLPSCKDRQSTRSDTKGNDTGDYFTDSQLLRDDPKAFLEARANSGRPVPACTDLQEFNKAQLQELNEMNTLADGFTISGEETRKYSMSFAEANDLYQRVVKHPVANLNNTVKYDPKGQGIGYCFGRAMAAHLEALFNMDLKNSSIRKLFAVGSLQTGQTKWGWHVTAVVKAKEGGWWAIDPIIGSPIKAEDWYNKMLTSFNPKKDLVLFHDRALRFGPQVKRYTLQQINSEFYNNYFKDLLDIYKQEFRTDGSNCPLLKSI